MTNASEELSDVTTAKDKKAAQKAFDDAQAALLKAQDKEQAAKKAADDAKTAAAEAHKADLEAFASKNEILKQITDLALLANGMLKGKDLSDFISRSEKVVADAYLK